MAIQMRRGNYTDFDPNQMVPGEFAVSNSDGNKRLFLCFARPGDVIEIPTVKSVVDVHEVEEIRDEALEAKDQAVEAAEIAKYNTFTSISATVNNSVGTPSVSVVKLSEAPNNSFRFDFRNLRGVQGIQGKQGVSVVDSYIDDNNHLIIVYSDSTQAHPHTDDAGNIGLNVVPLTKAQYDALSDAEKMDPEIFYWIKDMNGGTYGMVIGGGTSDYNELENLPSINGVTLRGALTSSILHIGGEIPEIIPIERGGTGNNAGYIRTGLKPNTTIGTKATAEGSNVTASGYASHGEGLSTIATGNYSHSESYTTTASGHCSHAEGFNTTASDNNSHAEGYYTTASGEHAHAEGRETTASGKASHSGGLGTIASQQAQTAIGQYNSVKTNTLFEVGNGSNHSSRSNAFEVYQNGDINVNGNIKVGGNPLIRNSLYTIKAHVVNNGTLSVSGHEHFTAVVFYTDALWNTYFSKYKPIIALDGRAYTNTAQVSEIMVIPRRIYEYASTNTIAVEVELYNTSEVAYSLKNIKVNVIAVQCDTVTTSTQDIT